jgi:hypothetical protein
VTLDPFEMEMPVLTVILCDNLDILAMFVAFQSCRLCVLLFVTLFVRTQFRNQYYTNL